MEQNLKKKFKKSDIEELRENSTGEALIYWGIGFALTLVLTFLLVPNVSFPTKALGIGDIALKDIKAHQDLLIEDRPSTIKKKLSAEQEVLALYDYDPRIMENISNKLSLTFEIMQLASQEERKLPTSSETISGIRQTGNLGKGLPTERSELTGANLKVKEQELFHQKEEEFFKTLGGHFSDKDIEKFRALNYEPKIGEYSAEIIKEILDRGLVSNKKLLQEETDKGIVIRDLSSEKEQALKDLSEILDLDEAKQYSEKLVSIRFSNESPELTTLVFKLSQNLIQPNLTFNKKETEVRKTKAEEDIKPVYFQIKKGEMIVREGERITEEHLSKLQGLESFKKKGALASSFAGFFVLIAGILALSWLYIYKFQYQLVGSNQQVLLLAILIALTIVLTKISLLTATAFAEASSRIELSSYIYALPFALGAMLAAILFNLKVGVIFIIVIPFLVGLLLRENFNYTLVALVGSIVAILRVNHYTKRWDILKTGLLISLSNMGAIIAINLLNNTLLSTKIIYDLGMGLVGGLVVSAFISIILPLIESFFEVSSDFRLLELADLNHPILRQMVMESPGTYHHSLIVGNLAEEAAEAIGANPLLARVGAYYHDIGKIRKPEYFIENQFRCKNKHDKLAPSMSSLILITHVKDGVELAREYKLASAIRNIIKQHHGTSLISFFYNKAKELKTSDTPQINEDDFRYPGPKPQTKEAAIVLLADCVEAACKTLPETSTARLQGLVQRIVNNIFIDGQLDECDLTLKDLHQIARSFLHILGGIYHHRINYPAGENEKLPRKSNGNSYPKPSKETKDTHQEAKESSQDNIKRLGLSG